jgi:hypothetical protein
MHTIIRSENLKEGDNTEVLGVHGKIMCGLDASGSRLKSVAAYCEHGNESSDSIKGGEFFD